MVCFVQFHSSFIGHEYFAVCYFPGELHCTMGIFLLLLNICQEDGHKRGLFQQSPLKACRCTRSHPRWAVDIVRLLLALRAKVRPCSLREVYWSYYYKHSHGSRNGHCDFKGSTRLCINRGSFLYMHTSILLWNSTCKQGTNNIHTYTFDESKWLNPIICCIVSVSSSTGCSSSGLLSLGISSSCLSLLLRGLLDLYHVYLNMNTTGCIVITSQTPVIM